MAPPSITKLVARLEADGLVERTADPDDRRITWVSTSAQGRGAAGRVPPPQDGLAGRAHRHARRRPAAAAGRRARRPRRPSRRGPAMTRLRRAASDTFRSLHVRNFRLFFGGQLISQVGNWLTLVAQTLLVLKLTDSGVALGLLAAAQFGPVLLFGPFAGLVADRSDKRQAAARRAGPRHGPVVLPGRPRVHAATRRWPPSTRWPCSAGSPSPSTTPPAGRSWSRWCPTNDIGNAVSLNSALMTGSRVVGPALAGLLITTVGFGWCFLLDGLSYLAVLAGLWLMNPAELRRRAGRPAGQGPGAGGAALRPQRARAVGAAGDDGGDRHPGLQLPDRPAPVRHPRPGRERPSRSPC